MSVKDNWLYKGLAIFASVSPTISLHLCRIRKRRLNQRRSRQSLRTQNRLIVL